LFFPIFPSLLLIRSIESSSPSIPSSFSLTSSPVSFPLDDES
jgi:hypothetical protein